jgi:hypothetical protein
MFPMWLTHLTAAATTTPLRHGPARAGDPIAPGSRPLASGKRKLMLKTQRSDRRPPSIRTTAIPTPIEEPSPSWPVTSRVAAI